MENKDDSESSTLFREDVTSGSDVNQSKMTLEGENSSVNLTMDIDEGIPSCFIQLLVFFVFFFFFLPLMTDLFQFYIRELIYSQIAIIRMH